MARSSLFLLRLTFGYASSNSSTASTIAAATTSRVQLGRLGLGQLQTAGVFRIEIPQAKSLAAANPEGRYVLLEAVKDGVSRHTVV
jgi:hypothetical protein